MTIQDGSYRVKVNRVDSRVDTMGGIGLLVYFARCDFCDYRSTPFPENYRGAWAAWVRHTRTKRHKQRLAEVRVARK